MQDRDPFSDFDSEPEDVERTIILPAPGGRRRTTIPTPATGGPPPGGAPPPTAPRSGERFSVESAGKNPLVRAAGTAFALTRRLGSTPRHDDVAGLRNTVLAMVKRFEADAQGQGASKEAAYAARYALCALIDETILGTPWGSGSVWAAESLLATLHNETGGGAKFFQILDRMAENPGRNIDLLEFLYLCLRMGFQGKYAVLDRGAAQLEEITQNLYRTVRNQRGEPERELSLRWRGVTDKRPAVSKYVPLWVVPVVVCGLAVLLYLSLSYAINRESDDVFANLNTLGKGDGQLYQRPVQKIEIIPMEPVAVEANAPPPQAVRIRGLLQDEIDRGLLAVDDLGYATRITVFNKGLFPSGSSAVAKDFRPVVLKIGAAVQREPGPIMVVGHTDSQPINTLKFPSNWHLSTARANSVLGLMAESVGQSSKLVSEGRADTEPLADNATAEGRQQNRRIEINVPTK